MSKVNDLFAKAAGFYPYITITSDCTVLIEGSKRILDCNEIIARILTSQFTVEITGSDLKLNCFSSGSVTVSGKIQSISLEKQRSIGS